MDKSAIEPRLPDPTLWTHVKSAVAAWFVERLIGRPKVGAVTITFPNGRTRTFGEPGTGFHPRLVVRNFSMVPETLKRGTPVDIGWIPGLLVASLALLGGALIRRARWFNGIALTTIGLMIAG